MFRQKTAIHSQIIVHTLVFQQNRYYYWRKGGGESPQKIVIIQLALCMLRKDTTVKISVGRKIEGEDA
jgi:hypothetical protein